MLGVGVGIVTGLVAIDKKNTVQQNCQSDPAGGVACRDQTGLDAASAGRTMSTVSTVAFAVGALGIGVGAVLLVTSGNKGSTSTAISPRVMPGGGGLLFARTF